MQTITLTISATATDGTNTATMFDPVTITIQLNGEFTPQATITTQSGATLTNETGTQTFETE